MPEIPAEVLAALRESRYWDESQLAAELRAAARAIGVPVAKQAGLRKMITDWENGDHRPTPRYQLLYRRVFADEWGANGAAPDLAMIAEARARHNTAPGQVPPVDVLLARAEASSRDDVHALAAHVRELTAQVTVLQHRLDQLEASADPETSG